jgi:hypothetical protein
MDEDSHTTQAVTHRFLRVLGIGGLAIVASLGLAGRVNATYFYSDGARASARDYLDRGWYYLLDDGQYYYLDVTFSEMPGFSVDSITGIREGFHCGLSGKIDASIIKRSFT